MYLDENMTGDAGTDEGGFQTGHSAAFHPQRIIYSVRKQVQERSNLTKLLSIFSLTSSCSTHVTPFESLVSKLVTLS